MTGPRLVPSVETAERLAQTLGETLHPGYAWDRWPASLRNDVVQVALDLVVDAGPLLVRDVLAHVVKHPSDYDVLAEDVDWMRLAQSRSAEYIDAGAGR